MVICFEFATLSWLLKSHLLCEKIKIGWSITLWALSQEFEPVVRVWDWVRFKLISPASEISKLQCISVLEDCLFFLNKRCKPWWNASFYSISLGSAHPLEVFSQKRVVLCLLTLKEKIAKIWFLLLRWWICVLKFHGRDFRLTISLLKTHLLM